MTGSSNGGPESNEDKRLNEDLLLFMRKRSETDAPRYTARLKTYVDLQQKRRKAAIARRNTANVNYRTAKKTMYEKDKLKDKGQTPGEKSVGDDDQKRRMIGDKIRSRSISREPSDSCRRRLRRKRKRKRSSCRRRRRRCSRPRRRRRSCRRRRRRRSSSRRRRRQCCQRRRRRFRRHGYL